jgi:hypothetical protein
MQGRRPRRKPLRLDYVKGSLRKGAVELVGTTRVLLAARPPFSKCWRIGSQSRKEHDDMYLTMHDGRCYSAADVKRIAAAYFGPGVLK